MSPPWLLVSGDFVRTGGMDRANYALAEHLAREGEEVHLVAHRADPALLTGRVQLHAVPKPLGSYLLGEPLLAGAARLWTARLSRRGVRTVANGASAITPSANWVHYLHAAYDPAPTRLDRRIHRRRSLRREQRALRAAGVVIANSQRTARAIVARTGVPASRVHTIYYGADGERFAPVDAATRTAAREALGWSERPVVLFVGALGDRRKGFDVVLEAWRRVCQDPSWEADLVVVGAGRELPRWRARVEALGIAPRVRLLGFRTDVPRLLCAADALVSPTRYEAYGLAVQEALCCALPAFVSASAGVAERYPSELSSLLLPDPEDAADLAERLAAWGRAPGLLQEPLRALSATLRARTWDAMSAEIVATCAEWLA